MSKQRENIDEELAAWILRQKIFFVATAPLSQSGRVNISPKGGDSFRILGPMEIVYQDYTGSGAETAAHLRENGRVCVMFCAFEGAPQIIRLHGYGTIVAPDEARFASLAALFPPNPGTRAIIHISVSRVSNSCGFSIPFFDFRAPREALDKWANSQGSEKLVEYRAKKNQFSIDGLTAFPIEKPD